METDWIVGLFFVCFEDRATIAKEIKKYFYDKKSGRPGYLYNLCKFRATCKAKNCVERAVHINLCIKESIKTYFPVILTDNGSEFLNPKEIEKRSTVPCNRGKIFYCNPSAAYQTGTFIYKPGI